MSLHQPIADVSTAWLATVLRPWLLAPCEWTLLWDSKAQEVRLVLDTGKRLEVWRA